jgi:hypothetical protein
METQSRLKKSKVYTRTISQRWQQRQLNCTCSKTGQQRRLQLAEPACMTHQQKSKHPTIAAFSEAGQTDNAQTCE